MLVVKSMVTSLVQNQLLDWYQQNSRDLPWRQNRDPYRIWISETMLQQTTTTAVIPYFEHFVEKFPTLQSLAAAPLGQVLQAWAGLGYYSRARNLHLAAQRLASEGGFPKDFEQLLELPGFGPYTSRSVASLAFSLPVGVVDGNVIRVLSRWSAADWLWWQGPVRREIQALADRFVLQVPSDQMNQALMELGRTICRTKSPTCLICPLRDTCQSRQRGEIDLRPLSKPKRPREIWLWEPQITVKNRRVLLRKNSEVPFLRDQWMLPGRAVRVLAKPKSFDYRHSITHHDIYVTIKPAVLKIRDDDKWVPLDQVEQIIPAALVKKALALQALPG